MKIKYLNAIMVINFLLIFCGCGQEQNTGSKSKLRESLNTTSVEGERKIANENFDQFFKNFTEKSKFQLQRIEFPLQNRITDDNGEEEIKVITKTEWRYMSFKDVKSLIIDRSTISDSAVDILLSIEDTGVHVTYNFKRKNGLWFLTTIIDEST